MTTRKMAANVCHQCWYHISMISMLPYQHRSIFHIEIQNSIHCSTLTTYEYILTVLRLPGAHRIANKNPGIALLG